MRQVTDAADTASEHVRAAVLTTLRRLSRMRIAICLLMSTAMVAALVALPGGLSLMVAAGSASLAGVYGVGAYRSMKARRVVASEPGMHVRYEGWCRSPDGCNYAMFNPESVSDVPFAVLRLPIVREMSTGSGWFFQGSGTNAAALVSVHGELLGAGRVLADGTSRWQRRAEPAPRFVMKPPTFKPPAG